MAATTRLWETLLMAAGAVLLPLASCAQSERPAAPETAAHEVDAGLAAADGGAGGAPSDPGESTHHGQVDTTDGTDPAHCQPSAGGPYYVLENDPISVTITCQTGLEMPEGLTFDPIPYGAKLDKTKATLTWTPAVDQAMRYELTLKAAPWNETGKLEIYVLDRYDAKDNVPLKDPARYPLEYGLPVVHLATDPGLNNDEYTPATITYRGHTFTGAQAKTRGATSAAYPKRSFTLKFTKQDKFSEPDFAGGFNEKRKIVLLTSFDDNSFLRQRLAFELWNRLDPAHIQVQAYNAVVFLNGRYFGLYTVVDHVDKYLMEDFGLAQTGNLYKARNHDANFRETLNGGPEPKPTFHAGYSKSEGTPLEGEPGAFDDLDAFVTWAATASPADFAAAIDQTLVRKDYEDWWIYISFIMGDDSAGKNSYHYHDPAFAQSQWRYVPWDLNFSLGQDWRTERTKPDATRPEGYYVSMNGLFERLLADETFGPALRARFVDTLAGSFAVEPIMTLIDAMAAEIDGCARRDEQKWSAIYRGYGSWNTRSNFTTYEAEVQYLRQWIQDRHAYLETVY
ncbi:MAG: CotH kinase family protein [Polyangiales bacterium]